MMFDHGIKNNDQLTHTRGQRHLRFLSRSTQTLIKFTDRSRIAFGRDYRHVQCGANVGTPSEDPTFAHPASALAVEGSHAHQRRDLTRGQAAQFRQARDQGGRDYAATPLTLRKICTKSVSWTL